MVRFSDFRDNIWPATGWCGRLVGVIFGRRGPRSFRRACLTSASFFSFCCSTSICPRFLPTWLISLIKEAFSCFNLSLSFFNLALSNGLSSPCSFPEVLGLDMVSLLLAASNPFVEILTVSKGRSVRSADWLLPQEAKKWSSYEFRIIGDALVTRLIYSTTYSVQ